MTIHRCGWCSNDPLYQAYHDHEWGKPNYDSQDLFEMLCLEGQQAGLSWITVLKKRAHYRQHFFQYSIEKIAQFGQTELDTQLQDTGLIRHRGKLSAIQNNAMAWHAMQQQGIDMVQWLWDFVDHQPICNTVRDYKLAPTSTDISNRLSKALKKNGFKFVGPTTCYAFMQAVGMVNDHETHCDYYE